MTTYHVWFTDGNLCVVSCNPPRFFDSIEEWMDLSLLPAMREQYPDANTDEIDDWEPVARAAPPYALPIHDDVEFWIVITALSDNMMVAREHWPETGASVTREERVAQVRAIYERLLVHEREFLA